MTKMTNRFLSTAVITALFLVSTCYAKIIDVEWFVPSGDSLPGVTAEVGDRARFVWGGTHNVLIHPTGDCTDDGAIFVGSTTDSSYKFTEDDVGEVVFACSVGNHCEDGQIVTFTVTEQATTTDAPALTPTQAPPSTSDAFGMGVHYSVFTGIVAAQIMIVQLWM